MFPNKFLSLYIKGWIFTNDKRQRIFNSNKVKGAVASIIANAVWNKSKDIRECSRIGTIANQMS